MNTIQPYLNDFWNLLQEGFYSVNAVKGLVIALVAAIMLSGWKRLWVMALGATIIHEIATVMIPVVANHAAFRLPQIVQGPYWRHLLVLYVGYVIVIGVLYLVKAVVLSGGARTAKKHG